jgi:putative glutamine amidotransferase
MKHSHPLIGIPCRTETSGASPGRVINAMSSSYINAVIQAGGLPVLIPVQMSGGLLEEILPRVDGLLFSGGGDIDPNFYHETPQMDILTDLEVERDRLEIKLMQLATQSHKPFLAICRGIQVMNVAHGGSLWQDIAAQKPQAILHDYYYRRQHPRDYLAHEVQLESDSLAGKILKTDRLPVNSLHHQGIKLIAPGLKAVGFAADGLVEALEVVDHPFGLGVQWHPEELVEKQATARQLFAAFVEAVNNNR